MFKNDFQKVLWFKLFLDFKKLYFFGFQNNFGIVPFRLPCETACKEGHQIPFPAFINATEVCLVYYWTRTRMDSYKREVILKGTWQRTPLIITEITKMNQWWTNWLDHLKRQKIRIKMDRGDSNYVLQTVKNRHSQKRDWRYSWCILTTVIYMHELQSMIILVRKSS